MTSNPRGLPVEPSVALLFLAAVAAFWRWLRSGKDPAGKAQATRERVASEVESPASPPFRRHRSPTVGFAPPRFAPKLRLESPPSPATITPPPTVAGREWRLDPKPVRSRWEKRFDSHSWPRATSFYGTPDER